MIKMAFGKTPEQKEREVEIKKGEKILKDRIGGQVVRNRQFYLKMSQFGIVNLPMAWHKINSQIRSELKSGTLLANGVDKRIDELIMELSPKYAVNGTETGLSYDEQIENDLIRKGRVNVYIPYEKSGVSDAIVGGAVFGELGAVAGALNEGAISWKMTQLLFLKEGVSIKSTGQVVLYEDMKNVVLGQKDIANTVVTIITKSGQNIVFKTNNPNADACKSIMEKNFNKAPEIKNQTDDSDKLLKYAELYEKGLLTREEFEIKKAEAFSGKQPEKPENIEVSNGQPKPKFCPNCGSPVVEGSKFCSDCGEKL